MKKMAVSYPGKDHSIGRFLTVILSNRASNSFMPGFAVRIYSKVFPLAKVDDVDLLYLWSVKYIAQTGTIEFLVDAKRYKDS